MSIRLRTLVNPIFALGAVTTFGSCSTTDLFADKWNSWVGSDWHEFSDTNRFQNCQQTGATTVQCDTISWNIDSKGTITGWYR